MKKAKTFALVLTLALAGGACFADGVYLTGRAMADFLQPPSAQSVVQSLAGPDQPRFWGFGWEVIRRHVGFGGEYLVDFFQDSGTQWWLDWYGQPFFISFHVFDARSFIDPFIQLGVGCAGRVLLERWAAPATENLFISIMPCLSAGLNLDLDGFLLGAKVTWAPFLTPPPATHFENVPLGTIQCTLTAGLALGRSRQYY
jgi:hypothetical protein